MSLDMESVYGAVISIINNSIGTRLSVMGGRPSIIKAKSDAARPKFPYATVDIVGIKDTNSYLTNKYTNELGQEVYETHKSIMVAISVRANNSESYELCNDVHKAFTFENTLVYLQTQIAASVRTTEPIVPILDALSDRLQEYNTFNVVIAMVDRDVDTLSTPIENVEIGGTIKDPSGSDQNVDITA
jgi:hypothetical protein